MRFVIRGSNDSCGATGRIVGLPTMEGPVKYFKTGTDQILQLRLKGHYLTSKSAPEVLHIKGN